MVLCGGPNPLEEAAAEVCYGNIISYPDLPLVKQWVLAFKYCRNFRDESGRPGVAAFDFLTAEAVVHWRNHPGWNKHIYVLTFHATLTPVCLNSAVMHRTCPSMVLMNDSVLSSDAATLRPR